MLLRGRSRRLIGSFAASLALLVVMLVALAPAASAAPKPVLTTFGQEGSGDGQFSVAGGAAVNQATGDVYVVDVGNDRVQRFDADGNYLSQFGSSGSGDGEFAFIVFEAGEVGIAVAPDGSVYVADVGNNRVQRFTAAGTYVSQFGTAGAGDGQFASPIGVGVDPADGDVLVADRDNSRIQRFSAAGAYESQFDGADGDPLAAPTRVAVDGTGAIYVLEQFSRVQKFDAAGENPAPFAFDVLTTAPHELAIDPANDRVLIAQWDSSFEFVDVLEFDPDATLLETNPTPSFFMTGLATRGSTARAYVVDGYSNRVFVLGFAAPVATTLPVAPRTATTAGLTARINAGNLPTTYRFKYGPTDSYGTTVPVPDGSAGSAGEVIVNELITDLQPETTYHYRVVATNSLGTAEGADRTFTTRATPIPPAGPGRGYELVSPAYKIGGVGLGRWYAGPAQHGNVGYAAYDGDRFVVKGDLGSMLVDASYAYATDAAFAQRTAGGWVNEPAINRSAHGSQPFVVADLTLATPDLGLQAWTTNAHLLRLFPELEPWANEPALFAHQWTGGWELFGHLTEAQDIFPFGLTNGIHWGSKAFAADGSALVASAPGTRGLAGPGDPSQDLADLGAPGPSGDPSIVYLDEIAGPFSDAFPGDDGVRELVNACTAGTMLPARVDAGGGSFEQGAAPCPPALPGRDARLISVRGASLARSFTATGGPGANVEDVVSSDGSRAFFMSPDPEAAVSSCEGTGEETTCPPQLFVRQRGANGSVLTRWISRTEVTEANGAPADQDASLVGPAYFEGASDDGDKVFFRTASPLTLDDPNGPCGAPCTAGTPDPSSWDLYMYDLPDGPDGDPATPDGDPGGGDLVRISAGPDGDSDCNVSLDTVGPLRFDSADGSRLYFTCTAPLAGSTPSAEGAATSPGVGGAPGFLDETTNLYAYDASEPLPERWRFISRLPVATPLGTCATKATVPGAIFAAQNDTMVLRPDNSCVYGTRDGAFLTFFTDGRLTGDDPDTSSGDIYAYDAIGHELTRVTAAQGGPGGTYACRPNAGGGGVGPERCHGDAGIGPITDALPRLGVALGADGVPSAFFQSASRLVAEDTDDTYDVYQWRDSVLSLLTPGDSPTDGVFYAGNDRSGRNVYVSTRDRLTWQDVDAVLDVYTARIGGGFPEPLAPPACAVLADACKPAPSTAPAAAPASSAAFAGAGNVVERRAKPRRKKCAKGKVRRGKRCVKRGKSKRAAHADRRIAK